MSLQEFNFELEYDTDNNNVVKEFYEPTLKKAKLYRRAVAFFTSGSLVSILDGITGLIRNNGRMELLVSPKLEEKDILAIESGYEKREKIIESKVLQELDKVDEYEKNNYKLLAYLIAYNYLDIKIVFRSKGDYGLFHEKLGIIYDKKGNKVGFQGSNNETKQAMHNNYESFAVYSSWYLRENDRIDSMEKRFLDLWNNNNKNWSSFYITEKIIEKIMTYKDHDFIEKLLIEENIETSIQYSNLPSIPDYIIPRDYQKQAINAWYDNQGNGIFEMATGTGKTITSLIAMVRLIKEVYLNKNNPIALIIVVPYRDLLDQWLDDLEKFNMYPIKCHTSYKKWTYDLNSRITLLNGNKLNFFTAITTNKTFSSNRFQQSLSLIKEDYIICIDEMHNFLSERSRKSLPNNATYRLGLSATLDNKYREKEVEELKSYFDKVVFKYSMSEAINNGFLTKYYYYPIFVELTEEEKIEYFKLSNKIGVIIRNQKDDEDNESLQILLSKRSRLISSADKKIEKLYELKDQIKGIKKTIFYCGDKIESDIRYIDKVNKVLGKNIGIKVRKFTSEEDSNEREQILNMFKNDELQALTAIRCLDEGIDIPDLRTAYILSSGSNPKEFIQRRGRVLRKYPGKEYATIYDFIVVPTLDIHEIKTMNRDLLRKERGIILKELNRFYEFAKLAENSIDAFNKIEKIIEMYR